MASLLDLHKKQQSGEVEAKGHAAEMSQRVLDSQRDPDAMVLMVSQIEVGTQARKTFENLEELAGSIKERGQMQPIIVIELSKYRFKLAYGERRLRAIRDILQGDTILARVVRNVADATELRLSQLHENIHRDGYKPFDLAEEFDSLMKDNSWSQDELAAKVGVSKSWVSKRLSLLKAPQEIQDAIRSGELAETDYYNNKEVIKADAATKKAKPGEGEGASDKPKTVALPWTNAVELAEWIVALARRAGMNDLEISPEPTKKELVAILARVGDVRGAA